MATVAIVGGGLAGLACAKKLVEAGHAVTVLEREPFLGGRASTFRDADGEWIEQGLHVFLGIYSQFLELLADIGRPGDQTLFWMDEVVYQDPHGPHATYGVNPVQSPVKTFLSILSQNDFLGPLDKLAIGRMTAPAVASFETLRREYDGMSVAQFWKQIGGTDDVMERFLRPFCRAIQFTDAEEFSAFDFLGWVHHSVYNLPAQKLAGYEGARNEIIFDPLAKFLEGRGATIRTATPIETLTSDAEGRTITGLRLAGGETVTADCYVVAAPAWVLPDVLPPPVREQRFFQAIGELPVAPAISVQLWFDRVVVGSPHFVLVGRTLTPVYQEQSARTYPVKDGSRVSVVVSPADDLLGSTDDELEALVRTSLGNVNSGFSAAKVTKRYVLRHPKHLIRPLPRAMSARPTQRTPIDNLVLAGDWTQQDFFGSQEGAVRGGNLAAFEVLKSLTLGLAGR